MSIGFNPNNFSNSQWIAHISGFESVTFKLKDFSIPSIMTNTTNLPNTSEVVLKLPGDHISYDDLDFNFIVDVNFSNYIQLFNWMKNNVKCCGTEYGRDISVNLLDNQGRQQGVMVNFVDAFPVALGKMILDSDGSETNLSCNCIFAFTDIEWNVNT